MARRRPEFEPGFDGAEAAKLIKFSNEGGSQIQWLPTLPEPIFQSRAV